MRSAFSLFALSRLALSLFASASVFAFASSAAATPPDTYGFGSRSTALGGAVGADVADSSANFYNPAGLSGAEGVRLSIGYLSAHSFLQINGNRSSVERLGGSNVGIVAPGKFGKVRFAFGLGLHLNDQRLARTRSAATDRPRWEMFDTRPHRVWLATNLAVAPTPWLRIGAGITFQSPSDLTLDLRGTLDLFNAERDSRIEHQFKGDLTSIRYPQAGIQVRVHERLWLGVTYRGSFELKNLLSASALAEIAGLGDPIPLTFLLDTISVSMFGPQTVVLSAAFNLPNDRLRVGLDVAWVDWSAHTGLIPTEDIMLLVEAPPSLGLDVPSQIVGRRPLDMNMHDTFVPRLGVEALAHRSPAHEVMLRFGYAYENSPFPTQTGVMNFVDSDRHSFSVGVGWGLRDLRPTLPGRLQLDAHLSYAYLPERAHIKDSLVDAVGDFVAGGHQVTVGLNLELAFE